jgi:hypothetical protein
LKILLAASVSFKKNPLIMCEKRVRFWSDAKTAGNTYVENQKQGKHLKGCNPMQLA